MTKQTSPRASVRAPRLLSRMRRARRGAATALLAVGATLWWSATASAQLDPLLFVKRVPPTVIIVFDTSLRMLDDGKGNIHDPSFYSTTDDPGVMGAFPNIDPGTSKTYRRIYQNLQYDAAIDGRYTADGIAAVPAAWDPALPLTSNSPADNAFLDPTRYAVAKAGIDLAVADNAGSNFRWGLVKLRQRGLAWRTPANCEKPVAVSDATQDDYGDKVPCDATSMLLASRYGIHVPSVTSPNYSNTTSLAGTVMVTPADNTAASVRTVTSRAIWDHTGLMPASSGAVGYEDRPLRYALDDAKAAAIAAIAADTAANRICRNTVVVLITSGRDEGAASYTATGDVVTTAKSFLAVSASGLTQRIPIHVVGVKTGAADEDQLKSIAAESGGVFTVATTANDVAKAINGAVQNGFARYTDFQSGNSSEFIAVSPVVGTVNLKDARNATGTSLPNTDIVSSPGAQPLPQRSNMMLTAGFALPGFDGRLRAFRTYRPESDPTQPTGWKFVNDGTRLWPDLDGRPDLAGLARVPADSSTRNIYTFIPNASGGGTMVPFNAANAATLEAHMQTTGTDTTALIDLVRSQPLGAIIGSTPALMDAPSLDPPPDDDYGRTAAPTTFAGSHKDRRSMIFFGANDGMIHAVDARTGFEVWAFIPYNLLPKLRALRDGQAVEQFDYFVDSSPKVAEVKLSGVWRSMLLIGQGPGGTFYQAFDVTEAGMNVAPELDGYTAVSSMLNQFDSPNESIVFKWAFPDYSHFDPAYTQMFTVTDGTAGGRVKMYGDLASNASLAEKTVGFTWSDPAVGPIDATRSINAVIVGSGYFPPIEDLLPNRGPAAPRAGNALYLINADTGELVGNSGTSCPTVSSGSGSNNGCVNVGDVAGNNRKNTLQADPSAAGDNGYFVVKKAYLGDSDGKYWRFNFTETGTISATQMVDTGVPIYASSALLSVGSADLYMFFATGSDMLPANSPGGSGTFRLYGLKDNGTSALTKFAQNLATVSATGCLATGERPSAAPSVAGDIVFYTTTVESAAAPCGNFTANLYGLTFAGGAAYDSDNSGKIENGENPVAMTSTGRATAPFIVDQHLFFATSGTDGASMRVLGDPEDFNNGIGQVGVRILSWREVR